MSIKNIAEIVIAVNDAQKAVEFFNDILGLNFNIEWTRPNEKMSVKAAQIGNTQLQVVESTNNEGVIAKFVERHGEGLHHIALNVENLDQLISKLKEKGIKLIPEQPIVYFNGRYIFIHPKSAFGVLIELIEYNK